MQLGRRPRVRFPSVYHGYRLIRTHGLFFGLPSCLDEDILTTDRLFSHPAVLSASTLEGLMEQIDASDVRVFLGEPLQHFEGYDLVRQGGAVYGVPASAGGVDLNVADERRRAGVLRGDSGEEVRARIQELSADVPVEFAGWLPIYAVWGNCGRHPQFTHTDEPPPGYRFTCNAPPAEKPRRSWWDRLVAALGPRLRTAWSLVNPFLALFRGPRIGVRARLGVLVALLRLLVKLLRNGARLGPALLFLRTRHLQSQIQLAANRGVVFLTSMPYTFGQHSWVIEIEDPTTLFYPLIQNGYTCDLPIADHPCFPIVKTLLEADSCKAILTHLRSTARMVPKLFGSEKISKKVVYAPLGVKVPPRWQRHDREGDDEPIHLLFINSWCQVPENFFVRGGLDILEAFATLHERYPQLRLTLRTCLPALDPHYHRIMESGWVRLINRFLSAEEMAELHEQSHIFLLPSARVHIVSLLQAMSYGLAVVASDGWGIEEYLEHERNGLVVKGRHGKVAWADEEAGLLREDYGPMFTPDPEVIEGIVEAVSRLVEDRQLRARLGRAARADVETKYNLDQWNRAVKAALDLAHGVAPDDPRRASIPACQKREASRDACPTKEAVA